MTFAPVHSDVLHAECYRASWLTLQGGSAEVKTGWRPTPGTLTLLGIAHECGSIRICTAALLELTHLTPKRLLELGLSRAATAGAAAGGSQVWRAAASLRVRKTSGCFVQKQHSTMCAMCPFHAGSREPRPQPPDGAAAVSRYVHVGHTQATCCTLITCIAYCMRRCCPECTVDMMKNTRPGLPR